MKRFLAILLALVMLAGAAPAALAAGTQGGYYGSKLTDTAAAAFYQALGTMDFKSGGNLSVDDPAVIKLAEAYANGNDALIRSFGAAVDSFRFDHTEYFYVDWDMLSVNVGRQNGQYVVNIGTGRTDSYLRNKTADIPTQTAAYDTALDSMAAGVQAKVGSNASIKDIAKAANDAVCAAVEYSFCDNTDGTATDASKYIRTAYGALVNGRAVCEGYSRLYKAVMNKLDVKCELVSGYFLDGESFEPHMWNYVQDENGLWYAVDVTMNDGHRLQAGGPQTEYEKYFWQTEELFAIDHIEDGKVSSVEYDMPYPELHKLWETPAESERFKYGIEDYQGSPAFWFSFDGKSAEQLLAEDGLYMALRTATTNQGTLEWWPWESVKEYNRIIPGIAPSVGNKTYFRGDNISMPVLEVGVFDIADDKLYNSISNTYVYSDEAAKTHLIGTASVENPSHDPDYIAPAFVTRTEPEGLFQQRQNITETQHIELEYDMPLRETGEGFKLTWDVSSYNNRDLSLEAVQKNAKLENVKFDGDRTISFDFTPSRAYNHNMIFYNFTIHNMVNIVADNKDGVALNGFSIIYEYKDSFACCRIYNDGRLYVNSYAQPSIAMNGDLSTTGWTYTDTDGSTKQVSESQRSQMALVVTRPQNSGELAAAAVNKAGGTAAVATKSTTYEIDLNICGKILTIPSGSYMKLNLGIPDEFAGLVGKEDIKFKLYHFKRGTNGELDYKNPEEIECVLTPYGIIAEVNSFSPYVLVAVDNSKLPEDKQDTSKGIALVCSGHGGKVEGSKVAKLDKDGITTYTLTPDTGYEVEFARLNGTDVTIDANKITLTYDELLNSSNTLEVGFVAKAVKDREATEGIVNVSPAAACTVTFESNGGSPVAAVQVKCGDKAAKPENPTKSGYSFGGWYADRELTQVYDFDSTVTASITLYAKWTKLSVWENPFTDIKENDWYYNAVEFAVQNGLFRGTGDNKFTPNGDMTRGMLATVLYRLAKEPGTSAGNLFNDVEDGKYYTEAIAWAAENNIVAGYGGSLFGPENPITREQLATILWRYAGSPKSSGKLDGFTDGNKISGYAAPALQWAVEQKIVNGKGNGILDPQGKATRAEVASMLMRFCETVK